MKTYLIIAAASLAACSPALAESRTYNLSGFKRIDASAGLTVVVKQGPFSVVADEARGDFDQLVIRKDGDTLKLGRETDWNGRRPRPVTVTVTAPEIVELEVSSGVRLTAEGLSTGDLEVSASSGASLEASGVCRSLSLKVSSGASVEAADLRCESVAASASSGASASAHASATASGKASSGGSIRFSGAAQTFTRDTSSGGSVTRS
jgi:hypothetical protein